MPRTPSVFPFSGRLRRRAINTTPLKRVKAWGDGLLRPEVIIQWWNTPERTVQHATTAGRERHTTRHKATQRTCRWFILHPTSVRMWHKAVFKVGPVAGPKPNTTSSSKNASDSVGIPLFGAPRAPADKPNPSKEG